MLIKLAKTYLRCGICVILLLFQGSNAEASARSAQEANNKLELSLPEVVKQTIAIHFGERKISGTLDEFAQQLPVPPRFRKSAGVFVTLSRNGKTRACWGSIYPSQSSIVKQTVYSTMDALTKEYRHKPIKQAEWKSLKPQVTVITGVEPISNMAFQNPLRDGLLVRSGGKGGLFLPGEAADAHYQLVQCKLKAGIKPGQPFQLYRLRTEIYE